MKRKRIQSVLLGGSETFLSVGLVLVFFLIFGGIFMWSLPEGSGLQILYGELAGASDGGAVLDVTDRGKFVAYISEISRNVKQRPPSAIAWSDAPEGLSIQDRHAIQTLSRSSATIAFQGGDRLHLDENSLVVLKRASRRSHLRGRAASLIVLGGRVRGSVAAMGKAPLQLNIESVGATTRILSNAEDSAEFSVTVNPDRSSTLSIFSGSAEVTAAGQTAVVDSNHSITLLSDQPPQPAVRIPAVPRPIQPKNGSRHVYGPVADPVVFHWSQAQGADRYRLEIARDAEFSRPAFTGSVSGNRLPHGNLEAGEYHWRVTGLNGHSPGAASEVRRLTVVEDFEAPMLEILLPAETVTSGVLVIRGRTEPGTSILVGAEEISVDDGGAFEHRLALRRGPNMVAVQAVDAAGNVSYHKGWVNAEF